MYRLGLYISRLNNTAEEKRDEEGPMDAIEEVL
jgi:hypothetical protein